MDNLKKMLSEIECIKLSESKSLFVKSLLIETSKLLLNDIPIGDVFSGDFEKFRIEWTSNNIRVALEDNHYIYWGFPYDNKVGILNVHYGINYDVTPENLAKYLRKI